MNTAIRLHSFLERSQANGPGVRAVVWFQGCDLGCPGCFNEPTHAADAGQPATVAELLARLAALKAAGQIEGVTLSGGEPLQQPEALAELLAGAADLGLSIVVFTGYNPPEFERLDEAQRLALAVVLSLADVLLAGRYNHKQRIASGLRGSANKALILLTSRYTREQIEGTPKAEIIIRGGTVTRTGIAPVRV